MGDKEETIWKGRERSCLIMVLENNIKGIVMLNIQIQTNNIGPESRNVTRRSRRDRRVDPYIHTIPDLRSIKTRRIKNRRRTTGV